jgi:signal transduction histidine kinase
VCRNFSIIISLAIILFFSGCKEDINSLSGKKADKFIFEQIAKDLGDSAKVTNFFDEVYRIENSNRFEELPSFKLLKGSYLYHQKKIDSSFSVLSSIVGKNEDEFNDEYLARWYFRMANVYREMQNRDSAIHAYKKSAQYFSKTEYDFDRALVLNSIGFMFWEVSRFDSALSYFYKSLLLKENHDDIDSYATTLNNIGTVYYHYALYDKALEYFVKSIEIQKEVKDNDGAALILTNIGLVYNETNQLEKALEYFDESLTYADKEPTSTTYGYIYSNIGSTYLKMNLDSADVYFNKAMYNYEKGNSVGGILISLKGLGETYYKKNDFDNSRNYFLQMLDYSEKHDNLIRAAEAKYHLGLISLKESNFKQAELLFLESILLSKNMNKLTLLRDNYKSLGELYDSRNMARESLNAFKEYLNYHERITDTDMERRLSRLKEEFDTQNIRAELVLQKFENDRQKFLIYGFSTIIAFLVSFTFVLYRTNKRKKEINKELENQNKVIEEQKDELEKINNELKISNNAKEKLFSIIAHDLKNPFFTLMGYISLLKDGQIDEVDRNQCIEDLDRTTHNTYLLLENLLNLSQSRTQKIQFAPSHFNIKLLLLNLKHSFSSQLKSKTLTLNLDIKVESIFADESLLEIVLRNLITNAIKFSNSKGQIIISTYDHNDEHIIVIKDNGVGMDEEMRNNLFTVEFISSRAGTAGEKGTGLGLALCKEFIDIHGGTISVNSTIEKGSEFVIQLPNKKKFQKTSSF